VIVPAYDAERYLAAALESALAQTCRDIEVLVVDDGSRDGTRDVADAFAARDARVRVLSQANGGVSRARNHAIAEARGRFIAPLDADDIWDPSKLERQVRRMEEAGEATGLVYTWWVWMDDRAAALDVSPRWRVEGNAADALLQINFIGCASIPLFRRDVLVDAGSYDETLGQGCDDWDATLRVAERTRVAVVPAVLVGYRRRSDSLSADTDQMLRSYRALMTRVHRRRPSLDPAVARRSVDQFALYLASVSFRSGAYVKAVSWGLRSLRSTVALEVLPAAARVLRAAPPPALTVRAGESFADWTLPGPLVPYDRIYERRFASRTPR
jgi:glycosyltransferase involved in cell wall biosynthesis